MSHPAAHTPRTPLGPIDEKIRVLRERGMSARAISTSLDVLEGWRITEGQVSYRCKQLGWHRGGRPHPAIGLPRPSKRAEDR